MEAVTIAGLAVVMVGGFYSVLDLLNDLGIKINLGRPEKRVSKNRSGGLVAPQRRIEKMAGMHV